MSIALDIARVVATTALQGTGLPAYKALFDEIVGAFDGQPETQQELKDAYAVAMVDAKAAHDAAQAL